MSYKSGFPLLRTALGAAVLLISGTAWAVDGRTAVGMCIESTASGARCVWSVNEEGEIDICNKNGCVTCESATAECEMARKNPSGKQSVLPEGTEVKTSVGTFKVKKGSDIDKLIKPMKGQQSDSSTK
jgi:hypothetical protein